MIVHRAKTRRLRMTARLGSVVLAMALLLGIGAPGGAYPRPGVTRMVKLGVGGTAAVGYGIFTPIMVSAGGRYTAVETDATNVLVPDNNPFRDVFVHDNRSGAVELVSKSTDGFQGTGLCRTDSTSDPVIFSVEAGDPPVMDRNGRRVVFASCASNLVPGDTNLREDIFVHDRDSGETTRVSVSGGGRQSDHDSTWPTISGNGRFVAFASTATNLVNNDTNDRSDIFVHDLRSRETVRGSLGPDGSQGDDASYRPDLDGTGRHLAFTSYSTNLVEGDTNDAGDVFVRDLKTGRVVRASLGSDGEEKRSALGGGAASSSQALSDNGRFVLFSGSAPGFVPEDGPTTGDLFVRDLKENRTERVSVTADGEQLTGTGPNGTIGDAALSPDGRFVAFGTHASNLAPNDSQQSDQTILGGDPDVFIHDRETGSTDLVSIDLDGNPADCNGHGRSYNPSVSEGGRFVAFNSCSHDLAANDDRVAPLAFDWQPFLRDRGRVLGATYPAEKSPSGTGAEDRICVASDMCIPPSAAVSVGDEGENLKPASAEADLKAVRLAYRPRRSDLFVAMELQMMSKFQLFSPHLLYGLSFTSSDDVSYEVRVQRIPERGFGLDGGASFGLFRCKDFTSACRKIATLRGGYGTTGMRVVFSLPMSEIGEIASSDGYELKDVEAFSAFGSYLIGATKVLDRVKFR